MGISWSQQHGKNTPKVIVCHVHTDFFWLARDSGNATMLSLHGAQGVH
jgi:hypothetical protein